MSRALLEILVRAQEKKKNCREIKDQLNGHGQNLSKNIVVMGIWMQKSQTEIRNKVVENWRKGHPVIMQ